MVEKGGREERFGGRRQEVGREEQQGMPVPVGTSGQNKHVLYFVT